MRTLKTLLMMAAFGALAGCSLLENSLCMPHCESSLHNASSLVGFLYPNGELPSPDDAIPQLRVPLRVGLAFLPSQILNGGIQLDAAHKEMLLDRIRQRFADKKFVGEIIVIPDYYLSANRGFAGLEGVQRLYNIDVMALISYDQVTYLDDNKLSLGYLTIVGAYVLKGSIHDTTTLVDLAVVDPTTRTLVIRAGGTDTQHGNSPLVDARRDTRVASANSFDLATDQMISNFDAALTKFENDVHAGKQNVHVVNRDGSSAHGGGGAVSIFEAIFLLALVMMRRHVCCKA